MRHTVEHELDGDTVDSIVRTELEWCLMGMKQDLLLRKENGRAIYSNDKEEDVRKIQQMIDALKLVVAYYSAPEGEE